MNLLTRLRNRHFLSLLGNGVMAAMAMVTVGILYRSLPASDVGYWFFFQYVFVLLDTFRTGFLQTALIKFYAGTDGQRAKEVLGSVWFLGVAITAGLIVINILALVVMHFVHNEAIEVVTQWFGVTFLFTLPISISSWIMSADQRFGKLLIVRFVNQGSFILLLIIMALTHTMTLQLVLLANLASCIVASILCIGARWTRARMLRHRSKAAVLEIYHFGKYSVGTTISTNLLRSSDAFIITFMLGPAALAVYNLPMRLMEVIEIPLRSFLATGMPAMSAAFNQHKKDEVAHIMQKYAGILTLGLIPVSLIGILFAPLAVGLLGGHDYLPGTPHGVQAAMVLRIFLSFAMFYPIDRFIGVSLDIVHQPQANFIKVLLMLAANVIGDFSGIFIFHNIQGVALATLLCFLVGVGYGYYRLIKHLDFSIAGIFKTGYAEGMLIVRQYIKKKPAL